MTCQTLHILVVAYQRPAVLAYTLDSINEYISAPQFFKQVELHVAINSITKQDGDVVIEFSKKLSPHINSFTVMGSMENKGKAFCLNEMFDMHVKGKDDFVLTLDQDMVFKDKFLPIIETTAEHLKFDLVGFASELYFPHIPERDEAMYLDWRNNYKVFHTMSIAGGIMLAPQRFLRANKWTNLDGIYGGDDFTMSLSTPSKFIVEDYTDWLEHDPIGPTLVELEDYYKAKKHYLDQKIFVLPQGWYNERTDM